MSSLQTLVRTVGVKGLTKATEERFLQLLLDPDDDHPVLLNYIIHLASTDMYFLEELVSCTDFVTKNPEFVALLLRAAFVRASEGKGRNFIRRIATKAGLFRKLPRTGAVDLSSLTPSQREVYEWLRDMADVYFHANRSPAAAVKLRLNPLLVGCSGVGKSHLTRLLARELNIRLIELTVGSWIPVGAKQSPTTIETLTEALNTDAPLMIFLDELDKYRAQDSTWALGQMAEAFALLDRTLVGGAGWTTEHTRRLRENTMIISAGTWSDLWRHQIGKSVGFAATRLSAEDVRAKIRLANLIPDELLNRFSGDWQILAPYSVQDFEFIARQLQMPDDVLDPIAAAASGRNYRFIEDSLTRHALAERKRERELRAKQQAEVSADVGAEA